MKLTYLGTAAAEGFPAVFCRCPYCIEARRLGGKNIRTRSQALLNSDLLIDLPADTYYHFLQNGIEGDTVKYLLITHGHSDHFYPNELFLRHPPYAHGMAVPTLRVIGPRGALASMESTPQNVEVTPISAYETVTLGEYRVTALPARHMREEDGALIYVIEGDKTLLYAHDTGILFDEVFSYIEEKKWVFDMVSLDCTLVDNPSHAHARHMGFAGVGEVLRRLADIGAVTKETVRYVNHFSHNGNPLQEPLEKRAAAYGCLVSYDGCSVEF